MIAMSFDRKIDEGGRIGLPIEFRQELDLVAGKTVCNHCVAEIKTGKRLERKLKKPPIRESHFS